MSSKELLGDLVPTLTKKAQRSMRSKSAKSDQPILEDNGTTKDENDHLSQCPKVDKIGLSHLPSYITIASEGAGASPEWVDIEQSQTPASSQNLEVTEAQILDLAMSYFPPIPTDAALLPLPKPVLIPRISPGPQIPFARAWAPELANDAITQEDFVAFIDNLNIIIRPHPAIRVVEAAALAVGLIPYDGAGGIAGVLEAIAILATIAMTYIRSKNYIRLMNEKYFHPRKLHAKIISSKRMMKMFDLDKKDPLVAPLSEDTLELSTQERCLRHLSKWMSKLTFDDIPPPSQQTNRLARIAASEVRHKILNADKDAKKSRNRAWKKHLKGEKFKESRMERNRVKSLDWILIQNLDGWEMAQAEKQARKEKKKHAGWCIRR